MAVRAKKPVFKKTMHVRKGDKVVVVAGADRSPKPREVLAVDAEAGRVTVQGVNVRVKHERKSQANPQGGRTEKEFSIDASNVMIYSEKAKKGVRTRYEVVDGKKVRVGTCGTRFD